MLKANKLEILLKKGRISHKEMEDVVKKEIENYNYKKLKSRSRKS